MKKLERRIKKLEAIIDELLRRLKLESFVDEDPDDEWMSATLVKRKKYPWK